jgi:hypothetical protein
MYDIPMTSLWTSALLSLSYRPALWCSGYVVDADKFQTPNFAFSWRSARGQGPTAGQMYQALEIYEIMNVKSVFGGL